MKNWFKTNTDSSPKDKKWWKPNSPLAGGQCRQHPKLRFLQEPSGQIAGDAAELPIRNNTIAPENKERRKDERPAAQQHQRSAEQARQHQQDAANGLAVCGRSERVGKAGVPGQREGGDCFFT